MGERTARPRFRGVITTWKRSALASGAVTVLGLAVQSAAPLASASCDGHECDATSTDWGCTHTPSGPSDACCGEGQMVDPDHWATTRQNAAWLAFGSFETIRLHFGAFTGTRAPDVGLSEIDIGPGPPEGPLAPYPDALPPETSSVDAEYDNTTPASGNLGEWTRFGPGRVDVLNATCSPGVVYVVIGFPSIDGSVPPEYTGPCQASSSPRDASHADGD